jgi:hypothetical protein
MTFQGKVRMTVFGVYSDAVSSKVLCDNWSSVTYRTGYVPLRVAGSWFILRHLFNCIVHAAYNYRIISKL